MTVIGTVVENSSGVGDIRQRWYGALMTELVALDAHAVEEILDKVLAAGAAPTSVMTDLLLPADSELTRRWAVNEVGGAERSAAMAICRRALGRLSSVSSSTTRHACVAVMCPEADNEHLPAEIAAEVLRSDDWPVDLLSSRVPVAELRAYLARRKPWSLVLYCSSPGALPGAARVIDAAHESNVPIIVTGPAFGRDDLRALRLGAGAWALDTGAVLEILRSWEVERPTLSVGRAISEEYSSFEARLPSLSLAIGERLRSTEGRRAEDASDLASLRHRVEPLLDHLAAAVLVDDGRLFLDFLSWQLAFVRSREVSGDHMVATVDALVACVSAVPGAVSGQVARYLEDGRRHLHWSIDQAAGTPPGSVLSNRRSSDTGGMAEGAVRPMGAPDVQQGQVFADLLFLAAMSCHAPMALISIAQPDGQWSTLSFGVDRREALNDPAVFNAIAARTEPLEVSDLTTHDALSGVSLATGPLAVRFMIGIPLRSRSATTAGVFCVLDRRVRELTRHEQQATLAIARQITGQLVLWRRSSATGSEETAHPAERRRAGTRPGPDAALAGLLGVRGTSLGTEQHLLRSHEVAVLFDVTERTVINWAASGKLPSLRTAGGHLRFRSEDVMALLAGRSNPGRQA